MTKIVLGGGLSGLSAAYYLTKLTGSKKILLIEASSRLGGWIKSEQVSKDVIFEQAARTIRPGGASGINTLNLLDDLGLCLDVVPVTWSNIAARTRLIYANGKLHMLPNSPLGMFVKRSPFSKSILRQLLNDITAKPKIILDDSAYEFTKRRFGTEIADYLIDTLICGICAGNSREVSVNFLMKKFFLYEQMYGSIIKGILKHWLDKKEKMPIAGLLAAKSKIEKWNVYSFRNGIETFPITLEAALRRFGNTDIQLNLKCKELIFLNNKKVTVYLEDGRKYDSDHILSCIPAKNLALLIGNQHPQLASKLEKIKMVTVGVVNLLYEGNLIKDPAFGFLVPPKEKLPILGVIYDSCCQNSKDKTVLTVMMGGYWFQDFFGEDPREETLLDNATSHLKMILGITEKPVQYKINILRDCIPQYVIGHQKNLEEIDLYIRDQKLPISLCGASYHGVGVNDVVMSARKAVESIAQH